MKNIYTVEKIETIERVTYGAIKANSIEEAKELINSDVYWEETLPINIIDVEYIIEEE